MWLMVQWLATDVYMMESVHTPARPRLARLAESDTTQLPECFRNQSWSSMFVPMSAVLSHVGIFLGLIGFALTAA